MWLSSVLHMGASGLCVVCAVFVEMTGFLVIVVCGGRVPMCGEGVCAHGSGTVATARINFPHDSAVSTDTGRA